MTRTRTYSYPYMGGGRRRHTFNGTDFVNQTQSPISGFVTGTCIDDLGRNLDHNVSITHTDLSGIQPLTGNTVSGLHSYEYAGWIPDANAAAPNPVLPSTLPSRGAIATETLARSNPSVPAVSVPNYIYELKDLPEMLEQIGRLKQLRNISHKKFDAAVAAGGNDPKHLANVYLSYTMGWAPLISDTRKLFQMQDAVDNRMKDLDNLFNKNGGLHRSVGKGNDRKGIPPRWSEVRSSSDILTIDSALGKLIQVRRNIVTKTIMWGTVRWTNPWPNHPHLTPKQLSKQARDLVFGLQVTPKEVWDAVPWSWLANWFVNFGAYLDSTNNLLSLAPSVPQVMTHERTEESWTRHDTEFWCHGGMGTRVYETKTRFATNATLSASIPIFSDRQLAVLGSLALQRQR